MSWQSDSVEAGWARNAWARLLQSQPQGKAYHIITLCFMFQRVCAPGNYCQRRWHTQCRGLPHCQLQAAHVKHESGSLRCGWAAWSHHTYLLDHIIHYLKHAALLHSRSV